MTNFAPGVGGIERDPSTLPGHTLMPGGHRAMLQACIDLTAECRAEEDAYRLSLQLLAHDVGHHVPTGFIDHHLILVVEATGGSGEAIEIQGPRLPAAAGDFAGRAGELLAKRLISADGQSPVPSWRAGGTIRDNRLEPGEPRTIRFKIPRSARRVRARLLYRRFWHATAVEKGWPDQTLEVIDQTWSLERLAP